MMVFEIMSERANHDTRRLLLHCNADDFSCYGVSIMSNMAVCVWKVQELVVYILKNDL